ncbi:MAG: thymidine phosphorylase [delta proteobacterium ML8_F1]|nr:MAG: thymidine phosphorylase [delta proteobacterium ML8_F1]
MRIYDIILKKRDGHPLTHEEIQFFIDGITHDTIEDYQAAALLMAIYLRGMDEEETLFLTRAMMHSGQIVDLSSIQGVKVDKHSTGGVGDTTSLVLAPLVASLGIKFAKMSGRGLGHTGGTIDKLEAIEGFNTSLGVEEFMDQVSNYAIALMGQTKNIAPADKILYSLRDVTATVDNISLIASSIMSKKLAAGSDAIILDVKVGSGAFLKTFEDAVALSKVMVDIGEGMGRRTMAVISEMAQPLGEAIGNAIEVVEAVEVLKNRGPADLRELTLTLGANLALMAGVSETYAAAYGILEEQLKNGRALEKFRTFIEIQGGNPAFIEDYSKLPQASHVVKVFPKRGGTIKSIASDDVGIASLILGAGRETLEDRIDFAAGIRLMKKIGDTISPEEPMAVFYTNRPEKIDEARERFLNAFEICDGPVTPPELIKATVSKDGVDRLEN